MTTRQDIAAALSTVDGISGHPMPPRTPGRGQGWPVWQRRSPLTLTADELAWLVFVTLPAGLTESTILEADQLTEDVLAALASVGVIEEIRPDILQSAQDGGQPLPVLTVTMTTTT